VAYETMWGSTEKMARKIVEGITAEGVSVKLFDLAVSDRTEVIYDMFDAKGYVFGSSNHDSGMLPSMVSFLDFLKGLKPQNRIGCAFGSYGWSPVVTPAIEKVLQETGIEIRQPGLSVQFSPDDEALNRCAEFGREFARKVKVS